MKNTPKKSDSNERISTAEALSPYKTSVWERLTPGERLRRSWAMRRRLRDPRAVHDSKLFPKP
jgi:hypothetical protein